MDSIIHTLRLWEDEGIIIAIVLASVVLFYHVSKLWGNPIVAPLGILLAASIGIVLGAIYLLHSFKVSLSTRALWFIALYLWCALGMVFFTARDIHRAKLFLALVAQGGILYALYTLL